MRSSLVRALCCCCALALPSAAHARSIPADTLPRQVTTDTIGQRRFDLPAGDLATVLAEFGRQAQVGVTMDSAAVAGLRAPAVSGLLTVSEALRQLLGGTTLGVRFLDSRSVFVGPLTGRGVQGLDRVVVRGGAARRAAYGLVRTNTALRTDTPLRDTPQSVTVVTHELIADQAMQGMADVVRYVPGITMGLGEGHRDAPTIRGISSTADFFVDGVRDDAQYLRDLYNVERVEALKGANALTFGRGGGGGVINRVSKAAQWAPVRTLTMAGGSFEHRRAAFDVGQALADRVAGRVNAMYEDSRTFRDGGTLERWGLNPTMAFATGARTAIRAGYELLDDERTVDRGVPSFRGRPSDAGVRTFFGDPGFSRSTNRVHAADVAVEHSTDGGVLLRNRTRFVRYDKYYANLFPGALTADGSQVSLSAYVATTDRANLFNQTDVTWGMATGRLRHTLLAGAEVGRQATDNVRQTGYFGGDTTTLRVSFARPTVSVPVALRQSGTDANNRVEATVASVFLQDQVALSRYLEAIVGLRYDRFALDYQNRRRDATAANRHFERVDGVLSPRAGLVFKPVQPLSFYGSWSVGFLPASGDQFASLTASTATLTPEEFRNAEVGAKWDVRPDLAITAATYQVDRVNSVTPHPTIAGRTEQTGRQRTNGLELGVAGNVTGTWQVAGGLSLQKATVTSRTGTIPAGRTVPLVPHTTVSLWNKVRLLPALDAGLGVIHQTDMYAATDNAVTLPGFTRVDGALFVRLTRQLRAQANVENVLDTRYYGASHGNNNIMPGAPRTLRVSVGTAF